MLPSARGKFFANTIYMCAINVHTHTHNGVLYRVVLVEGKTARRRFRFAKKKKNYSAEDSEKNKT